MHSKCEALAMLLLRGFVSWRVHRFRLCLQCLSVLRDTWWVGRSRPCLWSLSVSIYRSSQPFRSTRSITYTNVSTRERHLIPPDGGIPGMADLCSQQHPRVLALDWITYCYHTEDLLCWRSPRCSCGVLQECRIWDHHDWDPEITSYQLLLTKPVYKIANALNKYVRKIILKISAIYGQIGL